jgi:hypothetical protein
MNKEQTGFGDDAAFIDAGELLEPTFGRPCPTPGELALP